MPKEKSKKKKPMNKLIGAEYIKSLRMQKDSKFAKKKVSQMLMRIEVRIQEINTFLSNPDEDEKVLKSKISLLSSLLDVKKKIKKELDEYEGKEEKSGDSLGELLK